MSLEPPVKPSVLCVDDEAAVLAGLDLTLGRRFHLRLAKGGAQALEQLGEAPAQVVISDMRMPAMSGATFLGQVRQRWPTSVRILLTGQSDLSSAVEAVNEGQIFRFLTKPCQPAQLLAIVEAAVAHHRLIEGERVLLEQTLLGSVRMLTDVLGLVSPHAFGRARAIKQLTTQLAVQLELPERWPLEVAAMLSQLGALTLPPDTAARLYAGSPLSKAEQEMVSRLPAAAEQILGHIPRLEGVRAILRLAAQESALALPAELNPEAWLVTRSAQILRVVADFDRLEAAGQTADLVLSTLRDRGTRYAPEVLEALAELRGSPSNDEIRQLPIGHLAEGMRFAEDLKTVGGTLLVARGSEVTAALVQRLRNFNPDSLPHRVQMVVSQA